METLVITWLFAISADLSHLQETLCQRDERRHYVYLAQ